jgi:hypothetical protein
MEYYSSLLVQFKDLLKEKCHAARRSPKGVIFLHDNAPAHMALATLKKLAYLGSSGLITHPVPRIWPRQAITCSLD